MTPRATTPAPALDRECEVFARYLVRQAPSAYVRARYAAAHGAAWHASPERAWTAWDARLIRVAARGPFLARAADAYARFFDRRGLLRHKLVLLLAVLECVAPADDAFEPPPATGILGVAGRLLAAGLAGVAALGVGVLVLGPMHVFSAAYPGGGRVVGAPAPAPAPTHAPLGEGA